MRTPTDPNLASPELGLSTQRAGSTHLVRHGEVHNPEGLVYGDLPGFDLSARGIQQARQAADHLASFAIAAVWSSPLQRALRTADLIAARHRLPVQVDADLTEWRLHSWTGISWSQLAERRPGELDAYLHNPTDLSFAVEPLEAVAVRVAAAITRVAAGDGEIVVVTHQDPLQAARLRLTGQPLDKLHIDKPGHASVISLESGDPWREVAHWKPPT